MEKIWLIFIAAFIACSPVKSTDGDKKNEGSFTYSITGIKGNLSVVFDKDLSARNLGNVSPLGGNVINLNKDLFKMKIKFDADAKGTAIEDLNLTFVVYAVVNGKIDKELAVAFEDELSVSSGTEMVYKLKSNLDIDLSKVTLTAGSEYAIEARLDKYNNIEESDKRDNSLVMYTFTYVSG